MTERRETEHTDQNKGGASMCKRDSGRAGVRARGRVGAYVRVWGACVGDGAQVWVTDSCPVQVSLHILFYYIMI